MPIDARVTRHNDFIRDRHPGLVGVEVLHCDEDLVTGRLSVTAPLVAGTGFLWAPVIVTLADWLCACGTAMHVPKGSSFTTIEMKTNFLGTVREGGSILGRAQAIHRGRSTHVWDCEINNEENEKTIALFRCTQMILHPKA